MRNKTKTLLLCMALATVAFATACPERRSIADLESNPSKYLNKEVAVAGTVRDSYGLSLPIAGVRGGIYKIDDGSGSLWVVTQNSVPTKGTQIGVKGRLQNGLNWNGKNYGLGLYEEDRRFRGK